MKKLFYILLFLVGSWQSHAQLSDLHYMPPLRQEYSAVQIHYIYLTTPNTTAFDVDVYRGTSTTIYQTINISNANSGQIILPNDNNNIMFMDDANTGNVSSLGGLRFQSRNGEKFYVNYRGRSGSQATSITSKGRAALGKAFKWGGVPNLGAVSYYMSNSMGILATEDNTTVNIFGYDPECTFRQGAVSQAITADALTITLNKGESYVLEAYILKNVERINNVDVLRENTANRDGWIGASVTSDKPIAMNVGQLHLQPVLNGYGQDCGADQIIPENTLGRDYVFVRANGSDALEFPLIVATQNGTKIYVNGSATPIATINNGEYFKIPGTNFNPRSAGGNMYVQTSKEAYAYQAVAGANDERTADLNFIPPVNCLASNTVDKISNFTNLAGLSLASGYLTLVTSTTINDADIVVKSGGNQISLATLQAAKKSVTGTALWKTYNLTLNAGDVSVSATGPIAVGFVLTSGAIGASGYFSGFETIPVINIDAGSVGCLPSTELVATPGFPFYAWYRNGVVIPGQTTNTYTPNIAGDYYVIVSTENCDYQSASQSLYDCNPELVTSITADKNTVNAGDQVTFSITAGYLGYGNMTNLVVRNLIPANLTLVSATPSFGTWTGAGNDFNWNIGTMYPSEEHRLTVVATVNALTTNETQTYQLSNTQTQVDANRVVDDPTEDILFLARRIPTQSNFPALTKQMGQANFNLTNPTTNSDGAFTYASSDTSIIRMNGSQVILVEQGAATVTATQAETATWAQKSISALITVLPKNGLINNGKLATTSALVVNKNGARGFGSGHNQYGAPIVSLNAPVVYTKVVTSITGTTASSGGIVVSNGGKGVTARGVCWRRLPGATIEHNFTAESGTNGEFTSSITGLSPNTTYYLRAYSTNKMGTSYGNEISFTTGN